MNSGIGNVAIGRLAGDSVSTGNYNIAIGQGTGFTGTGATNQIGIGYDVTVPADNHTVIGAAAQTHVIFGGDSLISGSAGSTGSFGRVEATSFAGDGAALTNVPDYVYEPTYELKSINELEEFVTENKHLPNVPDMDNIEKWKTLSVSDRDMLLLEKIEELSLYIIELNKRIKKLENKKE